MFPIEIQPAKPVKKLTSPISPPMSIPMMEETARISIQTSYNRINEMISDLRRQINLTISKPSAVTHKKDLYTRLEKKDLPAECHAKKLIITTKLKLLINCGPNSLRKKKVRTGIRYKQRILMQSSDHDGTPRPGNN